MTPTGRLQLSIIVLAVALAACERSATVTETISFSKDVKPILDAHCVECHNVAAEGTATSGLDLTDYAGVMTGTRLGPMVVPKSAESSSLYLVIAQQTSPKIQMPPHHDSARAEGRGSALTEQQVATIKGWIDQGALDN